MNWAARTPQRGTESEVQTAFGSIQINSSQIFGKEAYVTFVSPKAVGDPSGVTLVELSVFDTISRTRVFSADFVSLLDAVKGLSDHPFDLDALPARGDGTAFAGFDVSLSVFTDKPGSGFDTHFIIAGGVAPA